MSERAQEGVGGGEGVRRDNSTGVDAHGPSASPSASPRPSQSSPTGAGAGVEEGRKEPQARPSQEHVVLKRDVCESPVHQHHLGVLNLFPELQQQEHSPAVRVWEEGEKEE